jgi:hypothetical protein
MLHNPACAGNDILVDTPVVGSLKLWDWQEYSSVELHLHMILFLHVVADVFAEFNVETNCYGYVDSIHFNEVVGSNVLLCKMLINDSIRWYTNCTMFLFVSPLMLVKYANLSLP